MLLKICSAFVALSCTAFAIPAPREYHSRDVSFESSVREKLGVPPAGWVKNESVAFDNETSMMSLRIHLAHQDMDTFHDLAMNIATPGHELYGAHLSQEAIDAIIAPKDESRELVMQWLDGEGLGEYFTMSPRMDSVVVQASVSQIEKLLNAEYSAFVQTGSGQSVLRTLEYSFPDILKSHVDMVQPTTFFGLRSLRAPVSQHREPLVNNLNTEAQGAVTGCSGSKITPACLSNLYSFASATAYTTGLIGIAGFLEEYPLYSDLKTFMASYATEKNTDQTFTCTLVNPATNGTCPQNATGENVAGESHGTEASLDVQYARAITESIPNVFYSTSGRPPFLGSGPNTNEPYLEFLEYLLGLPSTSLPNTLSISYGDDESSVPLDYATNVCNLFSQLGARGVSVLVASGDSGVGDPCTLNGKPFFTTSFPASCPWVTTVGGTTGVAPETAWYDSGGGFSEVFGRPSYQNATINTWLSTDTTHKGVVNYFNASGRAYPDVSAQSTSFAVMFNGSEYLVDGTSCATPTFAGVVQLLNSDRLASGKTGLGFLNPWLYGNATAGLTDIKSGSSSGCAGSIRGAGFSAVAGWDPATGLGTPVFTSLLKISKAT